jgi:carbamoyl-phosphate synthase large subunit
MRSTGEVMGLDSDLGLRMRNRNGRQRPLPMIGKVFISVSDAHKQEAVEVARQFVELGFEIVSTGGTAAVLNRAG